MFSTIVAIIKAIPILKGWIDQAVALYLSHSIESMHESDRAAVKKAIYEHDQRDLEKQIGSTKAGKSSDLPGVELRDSLPNVVRK